ncbi:MAG: hypothetical protein Tsb002_02330 [Wenzhouxiangellaceae bacterium]
MTADDTDQNTASQHNPQPHPDIDSSTQSRWQLIRDMLVFQVRLAADATRDVLLSPITLAAGIYDLLLNKPDKPQLFYQALRWGRRSEIWIDLFAEARPNRYRQAHRQSLDQWVERLEQLLREQHERGGITANAKQTIDATLDHLHKSIHERPEPDITNAADQPKDT